MISILLFIRKRFELMRKWNMLESIIGIIRMDYLYMYWSIEVMNEYNQNKGMMEEKQDYRIDTVGLSVLNVEEGG